MLIKHKKDHGFSLVEIVVATIVFAIASVGVYKALVIAQTTSITSDKEVIAANYGRKLLEDLRAKVDQRTWDAGWYLTCDGAWHDWPTAPASGEDAFNGSAQYICTSDLHGARKVTINVIW